MSDISLFTLWDPDAANVTSNTAHATIMLRAVGTVKFQAFDSIDDQRVTTLDGEYQVPHQLHNLVTMGQLAWRIADPWESPDFNN